MSEPGPSTTPGSTAVTPINNAVQRPQPAARRSDLFGMAALLICGAALVCAWIPRLCGLVIPSALVGTLTGLLGFILVLLQQRNRLIVPIAGAAVPGVILLAALFFPRLLSSTYLAWRAPVGVERPGIRVVPLSDSQNSVVSLDPEWADATKASLQQGELNIQVISVSIRHEEETRSTSGKKIPAGDYCLIRLRSKEVVAASGFTAQRSHTPRSHYGDILPQLSASADRVYELQGALAAETTDKQGKGAAFPVSFEVHVFVFDAPAGRPNYLYLEIPTETWGGGGAFRFTIPASMIVDERGKPGRSRPANPRSPTKGAEL